MYSMIGDDTSTMRITTLIENAHGSDARLRNEHGLSLFIETKDCKLLFDLGPSHRFADNAAILGIDLAAVDLAVISHGHYDHGGGLARFLELNSDANVFLRRGADGPQYSTALARERYIGLDPEVLRANMDRLRWVDGETEVAPRIHLLTTIPKIDARPSGNSRLFLKEGDRLIPDPFDHELVCVIKEEDGIVVLTGCGHCGATNMVRVAKEHFPHDSIKAVVGGFHLIFSPAANDPATTPEDVRIFAGTLARLGCAKVITGHCTDEKAISILQEQLGNRLARLRTGMTFEM